MELGHSYKRFVKNTRKKGRTGKNVGGFSPRYPLSYILNGKFNSKMDTVRAFFTKSGHILPDFQNRAGEASPLPLPSCAPENISKFSGKHKKQPSGGVLSKDVLKNFAKFTEKHLWRSLLFNKVADWKP